VKHFLGESNQFFRANVEEPRNGEKR